MPRGEPLKITLPVHVAQEIRRRAELSGIPVSQWAAQVVEAFVAGERCQHRARPEVPAEEPAAEE
jgi:hypothetical protein